MNQLLLSPKRLPVPEANALYLMEYNDENVRRFCADLKQGYYKTFTVEFIGCTNADELAGFAQSVAAVLAPLQARALALQQGVAGKDAAAGKSSDTVAPQQRLASVCDRMIDFVSLSSQTFSLLQPSAFSDFYAPKSVDEKIQACIGRVVKGLLSVLRSLNVHPLIFVPKNKDSPARAVGSALDTRLRELAQGAEGKGEVVGWPQRMVETKRVALILADRSIDFLCMVAHSWSYQALIHDYFGIDLNRVTVPPESGASGTAGGDTAGGGTAGGKGSANPGGVPRGKVFELDSADVFWAKHHGSDYPEVAVAVGQLLENFNKELSLIQSVRDGGGAGMTGGPGMTGGVLGAAGTGGADSSGSHFGAAGGALNAALGGAGPLKNLLNLGSGRPVGAAGNLSTGSHSTGVVVPYGSDKTEDLTKQMASALEAAPDIMQKKSSLDMHTTIAGALLNEIRQRNIDKYYEAECSLIASADGGRDGASYASLDGAETTYAVKAAVTLAEKTLKTYPGTYDDQLRLLLTFFLAVKSAPPQTIARLAQLLPQTNPNATPGSPPKPVNTSPSTNAAPNIPALNFLQYLRNIKALSQTSVHPAMAYNQRANASGPSVPDQLRGGGGASALSQAAQWSSLFLDRSRVMFLQGMKNLLSTKNEPQIVYICEKLLMEKDLGHAARGQSTDPLTAGFEIMDPLNIQPTLGNAQVALAHAVVFVVGPGSYAEAESLQRLAKKIDKSIIFGSTHFPRPNEFVSELSRLAQDLTR